jgi:hypothetical protein
MRRRIQRRRLLRGLQALWSKYLEAGRKHVSAFDRDAFVTSANVAQADEAGKEFHMRSIAVSVAGDFRERCVCPDPRQRFSRCLYSTISAKRRKQQSVNFSGHKHEQAVPDSTFLDLQEKNPGKIYDRLPRGARVKPVYRYAVE